MCYNQDFIFLISQEKWLVFPAESRPYSIWNLMEHKTFVMRLLAWTGGRFVYCFRMLCGQPEKYRNSLLQLIVRKSWQVVNMCLLTYQFIGLPDKEDLGTFPLFRLLLIQSCEATPTLVYLGLKEDNRPLQGWVTILQTRCNSISLP